MGALAGLGDPGACARPPGSPPGLQRARCFKCKRPGVPGTDWVNSRQLSRGAGKPGPPHGTAGDVAAFRVHVSCLRHGRPEGRQSPLAGEVPAWWVPVGAGEGGERTHVTAVGCPSAGARSPPPTSRPDCSPRPQPSEPCPGDPRAGRRHVCRVRSGTPCWSGLSRPQTPVLALPSLHTRRRMAQEAVGTVPAPLLEDRKLPPAPAGLEPAPPPGTAHSGPPPSGDSVLRSPPTPRTACSRSWQMLGRTPAPFSKRPLPSGAPAPPRPCSHPGLSSHGPCPWAPAARGSSAPTLRPGTPGLSVMPQPPGPRRLTPPPWGCGLGM